jgi:hypothetical protein
MNKGSPNFKSKSQIKKIKSKTWHVHDVNAKENHDNNTYQN